MRQQKVKPGILQYNYDDAIQYSYF